MASQAICDSHIHLWPKETSNEADHAWMTPGMPLARQHLLDDYCLASKQDAATDPDVEVQGVVYIETDVRYDSPTTGDLATWAQRPLEEILFLRRILEGHYGGRGSKLLLAFVPWAPMHQPIAILEQYLELAKDMAGPTAWSRLKGFRFLLQFITDQHEFEKLVFSEDFIANLKLLGKRKFSFDVGVDQRSGGSWQLESVSKVIELAHQGANDDEKVVFIINHLCKPDFEAEPAEFQRWCKAIAALASSPKTYMKLSGAFSELPAHLKSTKDVVEHMRPWIKQVFATFGPSRIMFGSDWPVCNLGGPAGENSWVAWKDVVQVILAEESCDERERQRVWKGTAVEAYKIG